MYYCPTCESPRDCIFFLCHFHGGGHTLRSSNGFFVPEFLIRYPSRLYFEESKVERVANGMEHIEAILIYLCSRYFFGVSPLQLFTSPAMSRNHIHPACLVQRDSRKHFQLIAIGDWRYTVVGNSKAWYTSSSCQYQTVRL